jgi:hypothetical protein
VNYSDLLEGFEPGVNFFTNPAVPADFLQLELDEEIEYTVDDATVIRTGVEKGFRGRGGWVYYLRGGYFNLPDSRIRMTSFPSTDPAIDAVFLEAFRGGEDEDHFTAGFEIRTPLDLRLDIAADFADSRDEIVGSMIYRFGKPR